VREWTTIAGAEWTTTAMAEWVGIFRTLDHYIVEMEVEDLLLRQLDHLIVEMETGIGTLRQFDQYVVEMEVTTDSWRRVDQFIVEMEVGPVGLNVSRLDTKIEFVDLTRQVSQLNVLIEYERCDDEGMTQIQGFSQVKPCTVTPSRLHPSVGGRGIGGGGTLGPLVLQPRRVEQAAAPTVPEGEMWVWRDAGTGQLWLMYQDPTAGLVKCQLT